MYQVQVPHPAEIRAAVCWDAQCAPCPALPCPGPSSNPPRQRRDREIQSRLLWRCQYRAPLMFQQLHEHLHMLSGHPKAAGEQRFGLSSSPHHLTICGLHDWANHNVVRRRVQHLVQPSLVWDPIGRAQLRNPLPPATPLCSRRPQLTREAPASSEVPAPDSQWEET